MFDLELKNKVAIITGGSDGLGRATARRFASEGAKVVICARREEHLMQAAEDLRKETNGSVMGMKADVCKAEDCTKLIDQTVEEFGGIDILINNAGKSAASGLEALSDEAWQEDLDLKLMGAIRMCRGAVPHMRKMGGGSIVNATTGAGKAPGSLALPTSVSRAAGNNLTKSLANELAKDKIRVNAVCIGLIKSAQWERRSEKGSLEELYTELGNKVPLGRVGEAEEYADLVAFLCSARGAYITGTAINLDGGLCPVI